MRRGNNFSSASSYEGKTASIPQYVTPCYAGLGTNGGCLCNDCAAANAYAVLRHQARLQRSPQWRRSQRPSLRPGRGRRCLNRTAQMQSNSTGLVSGFAGTRLNQREPNEIILPKPVRQVTLRWHNYSVNHLRRRARWSRLGAILWPKCRRRWRCGWRRLAKIYTRTTNDAACIARLIGTREQAVSGIDVQPKVVLSDVDLPIPTNPYPM